MPENPKIIISRNAFSVLQEIGVCPVNNAPLEVVELDVVEDDDVAYPPDIKANIDEGLIEVMLVPTGSVLQERIKINKE